jgi:hypothetical protein
MWRLTLFRYAAARAMTERQRMEDTVQVERYRPQRMPLSHCSSGIASHRSF